MPLAILGLLGIVLVSSIAGWFLVRGKSSERVVKIMMFVGYFWLMTFLQLILVSVAYFMSQHFY